MYQLILQLIDSDTLFHANMYKTVEMVFTTGNGFNNHQTITIYLRHLIITFRPKKQQVNRYFLERSKFTLYVIINISHVINAFPILGL